MMTNKRPGNFCVSMIAYALTGDENILTRMLDGMRCQWCRDGWTQTNGEHALPFGVTVPCEARPQPKPKAQHIIFRGRGIKVHHA